jgi:uncharacterized membrane protein
MTPHPDLFEMRRLESLSNTIFGVAMTLLAYDMPKAGQFKSPPDWADLIHVYGGRLSGLALSFIIAGVFWFSHHRRLARQPMAGRGVVMLNLVFLLSIILLPASNELNASYGMSSAVSVLYGLHLTVIAALNAWLWWLATRRFYPEFASAFFPVVILMAGTVVASLVPAYAQYVWFFAFGGLLVRRLFRGESGSD